VLETNEFLIIGLGMSAPLLQNQYAFAFLSLMECSRPYSEPAAFNSKVATQGGRSTWLMHGLPGCFTISMI
jgi:hypothetical protein